MQKVGYDKHATPSKLRAGDWMMIHFPQEETGKLCKLWHGPYRIISRDHPDITAVKIFFPNEPSIQVHQSRVNKSNLTTSTGMEGNAQNKGDHLHFEIYHKRVVHNLLIK